MPACDPALGGGSLWQDIPSQVPHAIQRYQEAPRNYPFHEVTVSPGTRLTQILYGERSVWVNSFHHQAVREVPPGFAVAGGDDRLFRALVQAAQRR